MPWCARCSRGLKNPTEKYDLLGYFPFKVSWQQPRPFGLVWLGWCAATLSWKRYFACLQLVEYGNNSSIEDQPKISRSFQMIWYALCIQFWFIVSDLRDWSRFVVQSASCADMFIAASCYGWEHHHTMPYWIKYCAKKKSWQLRSRTQMCVPLGRVVLV